MAGEVTNQRDFNAISMPFQRHFDAILHAISTPFQCHFTRGFNADSRCFNAISTPF